MSRRDKDDIRIEAFGTVDELNSVLGILTSQFSQISEMRLLRQIQNDLFDVGADLCTPQPEDEKLGSRLRVTAQQVERLEHAIDRLNEPLKPLTSFVLPGGSPEAGWLHLARTVCRRAERLVVSLFKVEKVNNQVLLYLNRLSDLFFVMSRSVNQSGPGDVLWQPGG